MTNAARIPRIGDVVGVLGQEGAFEVVSVKERTRTVEVRLTNKEGPIVPDIPWTALVFDSGACRNGLVEN